MNWSFTAFGFDVNGPSIALGAILGMTYGLLAVGLVLVYRANRIINLAYGQIGALGAALLGIAVVEWGLDYWVAFPIALTAAAAVGAGSEMVVVRRLRDAPSVITVIATLGLAQVLLLLSLLINSQVGAGLQFPTPPGLPTFNIGPLFVTSAFSAMLILTPILVGALALFLRRSWLGIAMRAAAANPDAARTAGVNTNRMSGLAWALAGALAAFAAILILPTRGFSGADFLGTGLLLRALTAAVVARMSSVGIALVAGIGVGVIEQLMLWNDPAGTQIEVVLVVVILVALLLQRARYDRGDAKGSWTKIHSWAPLPESYGRVFAIRNLKWIVFAVALLGALLLPLVVSNADAVSLLAIEVVALVGLSVGIITGLGGQLTLGQFALAGVGATAAFHATDASGSFIVGFLAAGVAAAGVSLVIGLPALRIRGPMLAVTTLGFAIASGSWLFTQSWALGIGQSQDPPELLGMRFDTGKSQYLLGLVMLLFGLWLARNVWKGGLGRRLRAVRDNEAAASAFSVRPVAVKLQAFMLSGFLAGLAGAMLGATLSLVSAEAFPVQRSIDAAASAVLGGLGLLAGPVLGALYIIGIPQFLPLDTVQLLATSIGWLVVVLIAPGGFAQGIERVRDRVADLLARRAGLDPAHERSGRAEVEPASFRIAAPVARPVDDAIAPGTVLLEARGLTKCYGGLRAVNDVDLEVRAGETLGIIGPNGAGKTTLFELIAGFTRANAGTVISFGRDVTRTGASTRARLGVIRSFQDASLFPTMTVLETVMFAGERSAPTAFFPALIGVGSADHRKEVRAREVLELMGLTAWRHRQIRELSTGTRRITELACMIVLEPVVLLLDEPSSGIAQRETEALGDLLQRIKEQMHLTLVVIEHDIPLVMGLSDRVVAMAAGEVIADGAPAAVRADPAVIEAYIGGDLRSIERSTRAPTAWG